MANVLEIMAAFLCLALAIYVWLRFHETLDEWRRVMEDAEND